MIRLTMSAVVLAFGINALATDAAPAKAAPTSSKPVAAAKVAAKTKEDCMKLKGKEQAECMKHVEAHPTEVK